MAKWQNDAMLDDAFNYIKNNVEKQVVCSSQPTTYNEAVTTYALADVAMAGADITIADGTPNGRQMTVAAKSGVSIDTSGSAGHVALVKDSTTTLLFVTTCTTQSLTAGGTVDIPSWKDVIYDVA